MNKYSLPPVSTIPTIQTNKLFTQRLLYLQQQQVVVVPREKSNRVNKFDLLKKSKFPGAPCLDDTFQTLLFTIPDHS